MLNHQLKNELNLLITRKQIAIWCCLILLLPAIQFLLIKDNYVFYRQLDLFLRLNSNFVPLLFPLMMVLVTANQFIGVKKNDFIRYTHTRISLSTYLNSKLIVNALLSFIVAFLVVFIPFLFSMYVEPLFGIVTFYPTEGNPIPYTTFEQFLPLGIITYGLLYSLWVGVNGMLYSTMAMVLLMVIEKPFVALSIPFMYYLFGNMISQVIGFDHFSPTHTIFPFSITQQPLWTIIIPFVVLIGIVSSLILYLKNNLHRTYE